MGKSIVNATQEERKEMALNLHKAFAKHFAHYMGIENAKITITCKKDKE